MGGFEGRCLLGGQYMGDYDINIYIHIYKICSSSMYINLSVSIMIPFGALIHYKYIYIDIQCLGRDHVGLSQNNVSPNPSV